MLPAAYRMTQAQDFSVVVRQGRRVGRPTLVLHFWEREQESTGELAQVQVGFIVSKQVGGAVTRNRVKRRLRYDMGNVLTELSRAGFDRKFVVRANPPAGGASFEELSGDLRKALQRMSGVSPQQSSSSLG